MASAADCVLWTCPTAAHMGDTDWVCGSMCAMSTPTLRAGERSASASARSVAQLWVGMAGRRQIRCVAWMARVIDCSVLFMLSASHKVEMA